MEKNKLSGNYIQDIQNMDAQLGVQESFDLVKRELILCHKNASMYFIDGFIKDDIMVRILASFIELPSIQQGTIADVAKFANTLIPYVEVDVKKDMEGLLLSILSGSLVFILDGFDEAIVIDARTYPVRSVAEPENDKVLRGPRDGFVETIVFNTALIRRHIRDTALTMKIKTVGKSSKTDLVICYMKNKADMDYVKRLEEKIEGIQVDALTMGHMSLSESLIKTHWYNPFPKIRYTERPDAASACLLEGSVLLICDNSPVVMILPTSIFDFLQETDDYYLPPITATYLRLTRLCIFLMTLLLTPTWYLLIKNPQWLPTWLEFIKVAEPGSVPVILQLFLIEFTLDGLKLASLNTPSMLSNSLGVVGALILGEFAVKTGWFVPEVILYMAFVAIANFTQPSYELGYAFKFMRVLLLITTALFNVWGFALGILLIVIFITTNKTVDGSRGYLYPLIPFNGSAMSRLLFCKPMRSKK